MANPHRVLAVDGGGVFGLIPATLLAQYSPYAIFDVFAGTSIGSVVAAYYVCGFDPAKLPPLMMDAFPDIFTAPWYRYCNYFSSKYGRDGVKKFLDDTFGNMKLGQCQKPLYIMSFDFSRRRPKVFASTSPQDADVLIADALLSSVSAPTYFPPNGVYVDGGLWANCPSVATVAAVTKTFKVPMDSLSVFSVGTGEYPDIPLDMSSSDSWGTLDWAPKIIDAMLNGGSVRGMEYIASELPLKAYCRWDSVVLDMDWQMDSTGDILQKIVDATTPWQPNFDASLAEFLKQAQQGDEA
jgi:patatin-like phospholipase/acyl hydrolase